MLWHILQVAVFLRLDHQLMCFWWYQPDVVHTAVLAAVTLRHVPQHLTSRQVPERQV